jgi:hypothetical protein
MGDKHSERSRKSERSEGVLNLRIEASPKRCGDRVRLVISGDPGNHSRSHPIPLLIRTVVRNMAGTSELFEAN